MASKRFCSSAPLEIDAHVDVRLAFHAFGDHLFQAAVEDVLFHLEIGNAVAQQSAQPVVLLEHHDFVPVAGQLLRGGQSGRAGADHGHALAGLAPSAAAA